MSIPRGKPQKMNTQDMGSRLEKAVSVASNFQSPQAPKEATKSKKKRVGRPSPMPGREKIQFYLTPEFLDRLDSAMSEDKRELKRRLNLPIDKSYYLEMILTRELKTRSKDKAAFLDGLC